MRQYANKQVKIKDRGSGCRTYEVSELQPTAMLN